jgi:hypothetical protein
MIQAVAGNEEAEAYFLQTESHMYCAEYAVIAVSAGLLVPLNRESVLPLGVTPEEWERFAREVALHNRRNEDHPSYFVKNNANARVAEVRMADLARLEALRPLPAYAGAPERDAQKLAFPPLTMSEMLDGFMRLHFPREQLGERLAPYQAKVLAQLKPGLFTMLDLEEDAPEAAPLKKLVNEIIAVVGREHESYAAFRAALDPLLAKARALGDAGDDGSGLFTPPSLFHQVLGGMHTDRGLLGLEYVGHGLHFSMLRAAR